MVMNCTGGMSEAVLRERLPALWRRIEDAHYSYLEIDDSPEKLQQKKKLEDYIIEYLSIVPHECKFGLTETAKVFQRTISELPDFSAYRAGLGWAALARYAANLLSQPWRKEYKLIKLYSGYFKHEVEANMVGAETLLHAMGYRSAGAGKLALEAPVCPDMVAAVSRDALIAHCECQIMCEIWESVWGGGCRVSWRDVARERASRAAPAAVAAALLSAPAHCSEIYSNITVADTKPLRDPRYSAPCNHICDESPLDELPAHPYLLPPMVYPESHCGPVPVMTPYGAVPYYYPVQPPYMIPSPVYHAPIKHATTVPVNGYPPYRYPAVPTAQLVEIDAAYENGKKDDDRRRRPESSRRNSTSKSGFSDVTLPSLPRSDTQPALSKAREDGMGTYESWDYVFRNLSSKEREPDRFSPSLDRDSRTLDRLDREERRPKYQPTTLDLEDGLQALSLDRTYDEDAYRTAKVNENLMKMKQEQEARRARQVRKEERRPRKLPEPIGHPKADALIATKVAADKVKLLSKKEIKDRKEVIKQQSVNGSASDVRRTKKSKPEPDRVSKRPLENGTAHTSKSNSVSVSQPAQNYDLKAQLIVSLDETDSRRLNGDRPAGNRNDVTAGTRNWECGTCTYLNKGDISACDMCGKSKKPPEIQPLTSGGRECPVCTLVNQRDARVCDACGSSLEHCPTYI